jgi:hypothetical protein
LLFFISLPLIAEDVFEQIDPDSVTDAYTGEFADEKWKEEDTFVPELPQESNLITIRGASAYPQYRYAVDGKTLFVGSDGVVRFAMSISSPQGVSNYYFQGLSCNNKNIKSYAYASSSSKKFISYQDPQWKALSGRGSMGYTQDLADFYFCNPLGEVLKKNKIIINLKYGSSENQSDDDIF